MTERRAKRWEKPKMIGPPAALVYDSEECRYPGMIRVSFDDGHTVVYTAHETVVSGPTFVETVVHNVIGYEYKRRR